jgi:flagellar motor switch/type III secretory pathway protein FliN
VIATLTFDPPRDGLRRVRFVPRANLPVDAACVVANGIREALRMLLGETCAVTLGEPVALAAPAWRTLTRNALLFATPGRATDVVFVLACGDARSLVQAAFGEAPAPDEAAWSALESGAIERIVARCAGACDALCAERRGPTRAVGVTQIARPVAYFDVRISAPIVLTIGVGIVRELSETPPARMLSPEILSDVPLEVRIVLGRGTLSAPGFLDLRPGSVVPLHTKVAGEGELNLAGQRIATGTCGVCARRSAFQIRYLT